MSIQDDDIIEAKSTFWYQDEFGKVMVILTTDNKLMIIEMRESL